MREIKFRAWDSRNNEVVYSSESDCFYINTKGVLFMYAVPKSEAGLEIIYHKSYDVDQFTGLKDAGGTEVYEGDVVAFDGHYMAVCYDNGEAAFSLCINGEMEWKLCDISSSLYEVVGNIHEHPELIK